MNKAEKKIIQELCFEMIDAFKDGMGDLDICVMISERKQGADVIVATSMEPDTLIRHMRNTIKLHEQGVKFSVFDDNGGVMTVQ